MFSSADTLKIVNVAHRVVFLLFLLRFEAVVRLFLLRETCEILRHFVLLYKNNATSFPGLFDRHLPPRRTLFGPY